MKTLLITGSHGMLGSALMRLAEETKHWDRVVGLDLGDLDISSESSVARAMEAYDPSAVINCAAFTNVEACEDEEGYKTAYEINATGVGILARACVEKGTAFIHLSTDYVYNGTSEEGVTEDEAPKEAMNAYGRTKRAGEHEMIKACEGLRGAEFKGFECDYYLVRTSWLYGAGAKNFIAKIIEIAKRDGKVKIVDDEIGCPTYVDDLAERLIKLLIERPRSGIYHFTNNGSCSRYLFGATALKALGIDAEVIPAKLADFPRKAHIAPVSILKNARAEKLPFWTDAVHRFAGTGRCT
jgi:dTDP-4-dehydrorhamnose reductase